MAPGFGNQGWFLLVLYLYFFNVPSHAFLHLVPLQAVCCDLKIQRSRLTTAFVLQFSETISGMVLNEDLGHIYPSQYYSPRFLCRALTMNISMIFANCVSRRAGLHHLTPSQADDFLANDYRDVEGAVEERST